MKERKKKKSSNWVLSDGPFQFKCGKKLCVVGLWHTYMIPQKELKMAKLPGLSVSKK